MAHCAIDKAAPLLVSSNNAVCSKCANSFIIASCGQTKFVCISKHISVCLHIISKKFE